MHDTINHDIDRSKSKLHEMAVLGTEYREQREIEVYGETITVYLKPMPDKKFFPMLSKLSDQLDFDEEADEYAASEAIDEVAGDEEALEEIDGNSVDLSEMDEDFVEAMQRAAAYGLVATEDDEHGFTKIEDEDEALAIVTSLLGGKSVELGALVLKITGDARDADKFREMRGRFRDSQSG